MKNNAELKRTLTRLAWVAALFVLAGLIISAMAKKEASRIEEAIIDIEPLPDSSRLITQGDILVSIERSFGVPFQGLPLSAIDVERLERVLEEEPFILNADAFVDARNRIMIKVEQREPILRIIDNNGLDYYLDKDGMKLPLSKHFTTRVLVATGNIPPHVPDFLDRKKHLLKDLFQLAEIILEDEFLKPMVEQIYVSNPGEFTLIPKVGRQKILLGPFMDIEEKLERLRIFYKEIAPHSGWRKYSQVDLRYKDQVVCR